MGQTIPETVGQTISEITGQTITETLGQTYPKYSLWRCGSCCAATREALDILGAVATFACQGRNEKTTRLSDQVLTITHYL